MPRLKIRGTADRAGVANEVQQVFRSVPTTTDGRWRHAPYNFVVFEPPTAQLRDRDRIEVQCGWGTDGQLTVDGGRHPLGDIPIGADARAMPPSRELYFVRREGGQAYGGKSYEAIIRDGWKLMQNDPYSPLEL